MGGDWNFGNFGAGFYTSYIQQLQMDLPSPLVMCLAACKHYKRTVFLVVQDRPDHLSSRSCLARRRSSPDTSVNVTSGHEDKLKFDPSF